MKKILPLIGMAALLGMPTDGWSYSPKSANSPLFQAYNKATPGDGKRPCPPDFTASMPAMEAML